MTGIAQAVHACLVDCQGDEWPTLVDGTIQRNSAELVLQMDATLKWFDGHYPTMPVLPGVAQVHLAAAYGQRIFKPKKSFSGMDAVKFISVVEPGYVLSLGLQYDSERERLQFSFSHNDVACSSGRILFAA